jgi:hypothetical protein
MPNNVSDLLPLQLEDMEERIKRYVEDDELGVVSRCTVRFKCGTLADPAFVTIAPLIKSFGPAILTHNWNGTRGGSNEKPGKPYQLTTFKDDCEWEEKCFAGKEYNRSLTKLYFESRFASGFKARNTLHGNAFPGLKFGSVLGVVVDPNLYIWAVTKIWGPFFKKFPYNPIYLSGNEWASADVVQGLKDTLPERDVIPIMHPYNWSAAESAPD